MTEHIRPSKTDAWRDEVLEELEEIDGIPEAYRHIGPTYRVFTRTGEPLICETAYIDMQECVRAGLADRISNPNWRGERWYLVARDTHGDIVGIRVSAVQESRHTYASKRNVSLPGTDVIVSSEIKVIDKGKGLTSPVEDAFQALIQDYANERGRTVIWKVTNANQLALDEYRHSKHPDPDRPEAMEHEQSRWQALYGESGKFGIRNGVKRFEPRDGWGA